MSAGLCITTDSFFLLFSPAIPAELAERNSTISGHMVASKCDLKTHVWNVGTHPFSLQIRGPKTNFFDDFAT